MLPLRGQLVWKGSIGRNGIWEAGGRTTKNRSGIRETGGQKNKKRIMDAFPVLIT